MTARRCRFCLERPAETAAGLCLGCDGVGSRTSSRVVVPRTMTDPDAPVVADVVRVPTVFVGRQIQYESYACPSCGAMTIVFKDGRMMCLSCGAASERIGHG